jgi:hypothetical protein
MNLTHICIKNEELESKVEILDLGKRLRENNAKIIQFPKECK